MKHSTKSRSYTKTPEVSDGGRLRKRVHPVSKLALATIVVVFLIIATRSVAAAQSDPAFGIEGFEGGLIALAVGTAAALAIIVMFVGILRLIEAGTHPDQRLDARVLRQERQSSQREGDDTSFLTARVSQAIANRDLSDELARELMQAGLRMTASEYILIRAAVVLFGFLIGVLLTRNPIAGILTAIAGYFLPRLYIGRRRQKRLEAFNNQLEDVLTLVVGALRAGYGLLQALSVVVEEIPEPASEEFRRVVREVGLGLSLQEALANLVERIESDDLDMIVTAISIQQEVGGDLAEILDTVSETIRERVRIQGEIRVLTTRQKQTGYVIGALPFILGTVIFFMNPEYIMPMFTPGPLLLVPAVAVLLQVVGFFVIRKIVDIEV